LQEAEADMPPDDEEEIEPEEENKSYLDLSGYSMIDMLDIYAEAPERISPEWQSRIMRYLQIQRENRYSDDAWLGR
jgi:hypothetical protein